MLAAHAASRLAPSGRVIVLVPTLDLLTQTVRVWREEGHNGPSVAVCSAEDHPGLWAAGVRTTTNPLRLAMWHGTGPVTMYATYSSLPALVAAFEGAYGQALDPVDLVVADEAHRTSGSLGKAWAKCHDQEKIPAARRLYLTATPRVWRERPASWEVREGARDPLPEELACSMDDEAIFGPVVYELTLPQAQDMPLPGGQRGLVARYQILVLEIRDPQVTPELLASEAGREEQARGLRLGALQAGLLRTTAEYELGKTITFHHRTLEAEAFCEGLEKVARRMHKADPERYPKRVWAGWLHGEHESEYREGVLHDFGATAHRAFLSNCRVLGEGVDCPSVDSVAFLDPKGSPVEIVQAIGRALRQPPGAGKMASLVVPVFLNADETPEDMVTSASYRPLVKVLQGLRAYDTRAVEMLATPEANTPNSPAERIGAKPEEGEEESRLLLRFSSPRNPVDVAEWVSLQVIDVERQDWARGYAAARAWAGREGGLRVPLTAAEGSYPLGAWIRWQRATYAAGQMSGARVERLEKLGMIWDPADAEWWDNLAAARAYYDEHGSLAAPRGAYALSRPVGQWLTNQRRDGVLDGHPGRAAALADIDPDWNPRALGWTVDWQRRYSALHALVEAGGTLEEILPGVTVGGEDIGRWLQQQRQSWGELAEGQRERLAVLGVGPAPTDPVQTAVKAPGGRAAAFERGLRAAAQYVAREGDLTVPRGHIEAVVDEDGQEHAVRLGVWLSNQRARRTKLPQERVEQLSEVGMRWS